MCCLEVTGSIPEHCKRLFSHAALLDIKLSYLAQNVSAEWFQFHSLKLLIHSTPSFLFDEMDSLESWWDPWILFKNQASLLLENHHHLGKLIQDSTFLWISIIWIQQNEKTVKFHLFLLSTIIICIDPHAVNLVLGGIIMNKYIKFVARIGLS